MKKVLLTAIFIMATTISFAQFNTDTGAEGIDNTTPIKTQVNGGTVTIIIDCSHSKDGNVSFYGYGHDSAGNYYYWTKQWKVVNGEPKRVITATAVAKPNC